MAPGYVIAACCETLGVLGLVMALLTMRAERRAKSHELRSFLRSGQSSFAAPAPVAPSRRRPPAVRMLSLSITPSRLTDQATDASAARSALHRPVARR